MWRSLLHVAIVQPMNSLSTLGQRQQNLLRALLQSSSGLTVEQLSTHLEISRNAVNQHIASLEKLEFIEDSTLASTGGRPSRLYGLSQKGRELFPRHYSLLANMLIQFIGSSMGKAELEKCLRQLGETLAKQSKTGETNSDEVSLENLIQLMTSLGYDAKIIASSRGEEKPEIKANNCVFHELAAEHPEVCEFDLALMSEYLGKKVKHDECMVRGGSCCRFSFD